MKNRWLILGLWGVACLLSTQSLSAFGGKGFNILTGIYQWDSGRHSSVDGPSTDKADGVGELATQGINAQSFANGFDTRHRGLTTDRIVAVQFGFTDFVDSFNSFKCRDNITGVVPLSSVGLEVIIAIWPGSVPAGEQRLDNAIYTQTYVIQPEDVFGTEPTTVDATSDLGITSNFVNECPRYNDLINYGSFSDCNCPRGGRNGLPGTTAGIAPEAAFCKTCPITVDFDCECPVAPTPPGPTCICEYGECEVECGPTGATSATPCLCALEGNGSNIRPLVARFSNRCTINNGTKGQIPSCSLCLCDGDCEDPIGDCRPVDSAYADCGGSSLNLFKKITSDVLKLPAKMQVLMEEILSVNTKLYSPLLI